MGEMEGPGLNISDPASSSVLLLWPGPCVSQTVHALAGFYMTVAGVSGFVLNLTLLAIHWALRDKLLDPTGVLLCNFLFFNLGLSILQFPFAASSSFAGQWLYGETGCQLYGAAGFFVGIGIIISLGLIIAEGFTIIYGINPMPRQRRHSFLMIGISWIFLMFFVVPPYLDIFGMFSIDKQNRLDLQVFI